MKKPGYQTYDYLPCRSCSTPTGHKSGHCLLCRRKIGIQYEQVKNKAWREPTAEEKGKR